MPTIDDTVFVDGTFDAANIIYGRTQAPTGSANTVRTVNVSFSSHGKTSLAGTGPVIVVVTGFSGIPGNRVTDTGFTNATITNPSATGFTLNVHRMDTNSTWVFWMAVRSP